MQTISRRDFVNGLLVASTLGPIVPAFAAPAETACGDVLARDPRVLRGGNRPAAFNIAHWMRDGRLKFAAKSVTLEAGCDNRAGSFDISEDGERYDVAIVGGGLSGLSAAFFLLRHAPKNTHYRARCQRPAGRQCVTRRRGAPAGDVLDGRRLLLRAVQ
jgi:spermidine dehydrogenase